MLVISDVHNAVDALARVVRAEETIVILGDLVNLTDYRTGEGAVAEVLGSEFAQATGRARGRNDYGSMQELWGKAAHGNIEGVRNRIVEAVGRQYEAVRQALEGGRGYVIHGNVDRPDLLRASLPSSFSYVHGRNLEIDGVRFGFVGGGMRTPLKAAGEIDESTMTEMLKDLGTVDVLCTHVPPAIRPLRFDVVTGRTERGSAAVLEFLTDTQPILHLFGDVHQPQARRWTLGVTTCHNVGYFRATGSGLRLDLAAIRRRLATLRT